MARRGQLGIWLRTGIAFVLGFFAGLVVEFVIGTKGQAGLAIGVAGALAIVASSLAAVLPELFTRTREHRLFLREHADLLFAQVYVPIQAAGVTIVGYQLSVPELSTDLSRRGVPDWGYRDAANSNLVPVSELANWNLGKSHFETDSGLSDSFRSTWKRLGDRVSRKEALDALYLQKVRGAIEAVYGPGFPVASPFTTPEPSRWFDGSTIINWLRAGIFGYDFTEQVAGTQHRILGGGRIALTSDQPFATPASEFSRVVKICAEDSELSSAWRSWSAEDAKDKEQLSAFLRLVKHAGERIQVTHEILGQCEVCVR